MVCGYGDQVSYGDSPGICKVRSTSPRASPTGRAGPCPMRRSTYALADVTYLRDIYLSCPKARKIRPHSTGSRTR